MNKVYILGRLGRDPEVRYTQSGTPVGNMNIATDESYVDKQNQKQEKTEWHRVIVFGKQAENCGKYLVKGSQVLVEGSLQTRKWQDQLGNDRYTTEVKAKQVTFLLNRKAQDQDQQPQTSPQQSQNQQNPPPRQNAPQGEADPFGGDDIPF